MPPFAPIYFLLAGLASTALAQPAGSTHAPAPDFPTWQYSVRPGDTLLALSERYLLDPKAWLQIQRLNHIADPRQIPVGTLLRFPSNLLRSTPGWATLKSVHGAVRWRTPGSDWQNASVGQQLGAGTELETQDQANAMLELANGTQLALQPRSALLLDTLSLYAGGLMADTRVRLQGGQAEIKDNPEHRGQQNLRIFTPSAQATVRGTVFRVGFKTTTLARKPWRGPWHWPRADKLSRLTSRRAVWPVPGSHPPPHDRCWRRQT